MKSLYIFKTTPYNLTNLPQFCFILSRDDLYDPCQPTIADGNLGMDVANWIKEVSPDNPSQTFRNIDWQENVKLLNRFVNKTNPLVFGNNDAKQIDFLANYYGSQATTIACVYSDSSYDIMLTWYVLRHIRLQDFGIIPFNETDTSLRKSNVDLVEYYKKSFDEQQLVPRSMVDKCDYNIPIEDLFSYDKFFQHVTNIGSLPSAKAIDYYNKWYAYNKI